MQKTAKDIFMAKATSRNITPEEKVILQQGITRSEQEIIGSVLPLEILKEIIELNKTRFNLKSLVRNLTVTYKDGMSGYSITEGDFLEEFDGLIKEVASDKIKGISWGLKKYGKIYSTPKSYVEDTEMYYDYFKNKISKILINTENKIIYNKILEQPKHAIEIVKESSPTSIRFDLKEFFKKIISNEVEKNVYMSLNLLDELSFISDMNGKLLITDNPLVPNGKLLCGKPIIVVPNSVFRSVNGKEILVYGDLLDSIALFELRAKEVMSTEETKKAFERNLIETRVIGHYDCKIISTDNFIVAEINLDPSIPV